MGFGSFIAGVGKKVGKAAAGAAKGNGDDDGSPYGYSRIAKGIRKLVHPKKADTSSESDDGGWYDPIMQFRKGGPVRKTGVAKVHKGERVLTKRQAKKYSRRKAGGK